MNNSKNIFTQKQNKMAGEISRQELNGDYNFGSQYFNIKASTVVALDEHFVVHTEDGPQRLNVKITADFNDIPQKYHEIFLNVLTSKYLNTVSYGANPFSECRPVVKRKWWQFWKSPYITQ